MDNVGLSLFNPGLSLQVDAVNQQEREEEEEEEEERRRIDEELKERLKGAFDDLDLEEEEDGEGSSYYGSPPPRINHQDMVTPGQVPPNYLTSTPYINNPTYLGNHQQHFQQLAAEETEFDEVGGAGEGTLAAGTPSAPQRAVQFLDQRPQEKPPIPEDAYTGDRLNKSDIEKAMEKRIGNSSDYSDLMLLYTARGREIERLEAEVKSFKDANFNQLRNLRHQLALATAEKQQQSGSCSQLEQLLADSRRENKALAEEVYSLKERTATLETERESMGQELEGSRQAVDQLQKQLHQLQTSDTVLRARQQHDAMVRSMKERHEQETQSLRRELDASQAASRATAAQGDQLRTQLTELQARHDEAMRHADITALELRRQLSQVQSECSRLRQEASELDQVRARLTAAEQAAAALAQTVTRYETRIRHLEQEVAGYEAMAGDEASDSIIAMGLTRGQPSTSQGDGSFKLRDELQRSLMGNKAKREEIARLENVLKEKDKQLISLGESQSKLQTENKQLRQQIGESLAKAKSGEENRGGEKRSEELQQEVDQLRSTARQLQADLDAMEQENMKVKKCMSELVESHEEDKMAAIDSLKEEYEEHCRIAVQETKSIMEVEVRRLKIELDVYNKTFAELRKKIKEAEDKQKEAEARQREVVEAKAVLEAEMTSLKLKLNELQSEKQEADTEEEERREAQLQQRLERTRQELRMQWEMSQKADIEEAVARARLDWLKRLPEIDNKEAAHRESIDQLDGMRIQLEAASKARDALSLALAAEKTRREEADKEVDRWRQQEAKWRQEAEDAQNSHKKTMKESEELRRSVADQQAEWERVVRSNRDQADQDRRALLTRLEDQNREWENRLKLKETEKSDVEDRLDKLETDFNLAKSKWTRVLAEKNKSIESLSACVRSNSKDVELLKGELEARAQHEESQRVEMEHVMSRWREEVRNIQLQHEEEHRDLIEMRDKYQGLKSKVRKYQRHVEDKEAYYKQEYARLEAEFRGTLERLRERMEKAYSNKEREVDKELGNIREHFTQELRIMAARTAVTSNNKEKANTLDKNIQNEDLAKFYSAACSQINNLKK